MYVGDWDVEVLRPITDFGTIFVHSVGKNAQAFKRDCGTFVGSKPHLWVKLDLWTKPISAVALFCTNNPNLKLKLGDVVIVPIAPWCTDRSRGAAH